MYKTIKWFLLKCDLRNQPLALIYPPHFEDVQCQSGVNLIYEG